MNAARSFFFGATLFVVSALAIAGCGGGGSGPAPVALSSPPLPTPTPAARLLYVDHNGILDQYALPLSAASRPLKRLVEAPGSGLAPQLAVDPHGKVAIVTSSTLRVFNPPIASFAPSRAQLTIPLTPAITQVGPAGAELSDVEYDPNGNLWLISVLGEVSELAVPLSRSSVAALTILFGAPGSKTSGYFPIHASFDVSASLYVFAAQSTRARLFKSSFPYTKPPSPDGLDLDFADFVDTSQYLPTNPNPVSVILGQYFGPLASPPPGKPPPPPVNRLAQFAEPLNPVLGLFPNATVNMLIGAVVADPPRNLFYALDQLTGRLDAYHLPLSNDAKPDVSLACLGGASYCSNKPEHLFLAP
ncbi:MAG: hypothetical protein WB615_00940 [Candidatus Tumulicola sp.]